LRAALELIDRVLEQRLPVIALWLDAPFGDRVPEHELERDASRRDVQLCQRRVGSAGKQVGVAVRSAQSDLLEVDPLDFGPDAPSISRRALLRAFRVPGTDRHPAHADGHARRATAAGYP
jgi:hypothetical protein